MNETLAIHGGSSAISVPLSPFKSIGEDEVSAAAEVVRGQVLSAYIGAPGEGFMGGPHVRAFEQKAAAHFGVRHALAVNSWTSGLIAAVGAMGIEPGDEIITTPWTMSATAMAILHWNAIPVFADIDLTTFNIDPASTERLVTDRTRAILLVDIFGQAADVGALREIADRHGLVLLGDTAQAPGAQHDNRFTGTQVDIGGFSLNYHKHIHCGEGGILVTDDDEYARKLALIRNHAESVVDPASDDLVNMVGYNFRMGEIEAAIASVQLDKLAERVADRQRVAEELDAGLSGLRGLTTPRVEADGTHVYYVYGMTLDIEGLGVSRAAIIAALKAEGVPGLMAGYTNIHRLPIFTQQIAYGADHFPWSLRPDREFIYGTGSCPVAEDLHDSRFLGINLCMFQFPSEDVAKVVAAFNKVWGQIDTL